MLSMTNRARTALLLACLAAPLPSGSAWSEGGVVPVTASGPRSGDVAALHAAWQGCLHRSFGLRATLAGPNLAADAALRACRGPEEAYLAALSVSPLVDDEDVARVRPALLARARGWLLGQRPSQSL